MRAAYAFDTLDAAAVALDGAGFVPSDIGGWLRDDGSIAIAEGVAGGARIAVAIMWRSEPDVAFLTLPDPSSSLQDSPEVTPPPPPDIISMFQCRYMLRRMPGSTMSRSLLDDVDEWLAAPLAEDEVVPIEVLDARDAWNRATEVRRTSPLVTTVAERFGIPPERMVELWAIASKVEV